MSDLKDQQEKDFIIEKIKERPMSKKRLMRRTLITAVMAVLFGMVACFTFIFLQPVITNWLYPEEEASQILFPEDQEEMSPEEMLAEAMHAEMEQNNQQAEDGGSEAPVNPELSPEQVAQILEDVKLDLGNYQELYSTMTDYVKELNGFLVTVTGISSDVDWLDNVVENTNQSFGVMVAVTEQELYILADHEPLRGAERVTVTFRDQNTAEAAIRQYDEVTDIAVIVVNLSGVSAEQMENLEVATLGSSYSGSTGAGMPVVALGSPMGTNGSVGYGMITAVSQTLPVVDGSYKLLYTDIYGSQKASGVLFNMQKEVVGIITDQFGNSDMRNVVSAVGISELKKLINKLSSSDGTRMPYLGITVVDVSEEARTELNLPVGAYVTDIQSDSPTITEGLQKGDIIVSVNEQTVTGASGYAAAFMGLNAGEEATLKVMRQSQEEYREMELTVTVGGKGLGE